MVVLLARTLSDENELNTVKIYRADSSAFKGNA